jgi:DNA-binding NtrC family response regulator
MPKILLVDDEKSVRYSFKKLLNSPVYELFEASDAYVALEIFNTIKPDLVIIDIEMPGKSGLDLLKELKALSPFTPIIIITAYGSGDRVIKAMKYGAYEYVEKPFDIPKLILLIEEALKYTGGLAEENKLQIDKHNITHIRKTKTDDKIIGESPAIKEVYKLIGRVAASDAGILLVGESGTGKELVAKAIHEYSERSAKPFVAINCAAIPESLLESELFGYDRGAFTGAEKTKLGKFEDAEGGTLFLDEIAEMGSSLQAKLLRVLQEETFERLGGTKTIHANVRIIAATNKNLENEINSKNFREDLYYRLKVVTITLPPLRIRKEDIHVLTKHFLQKHSKETRIDAITLHPETMVRMLEYDWPGNIRELENVLKRALILAKGSIITPELITTEFADTKRSGRQAFNRLDNYLSPEIKKQKGEIYRLTCNEMDKDLIQWALSLTGGNQAHAARLLGISRVMLHERMDKYNLSKA